MITENEKSEFWIISDTHLIADSLHDSGQAFSQMQKTSQGKDLYYQEVVLNSFVKMANEKKPAAIVVTGDLTFNGERVSANRFSKIFANLIDTKLLVLPGNHDIYDGWARKFRGKKQFYEGQISPMFWKSIFSESYKKIVSSDKSSLAYSYQFNPNYFFICLDSNCYGKEESFSAPHTHGSIKEKQLKWLIEQLKWSSMHKLNPIVFMHHNLYTHNPAVSSGFVLDNASDLKRIFQKYDVKIVFSGHIHAQNIINAHGVVPTSEIVTSSFCSLDQGYGVVKVNKNKLSYVRHSFDMRPFLTDKEKQNWTLTHFHEYLKDIQLGSLASQIIERDYQKYHNTKNLLKDMGELFATMNYNFFTGRNYINQDKLKIIHNSAAYKTLIKENPEYKIYMETLYVTDKHNNSKFNIEYRKSKV